MKDELSKYIVSLKQEVHNLREDNPPSSMSEWSRNQTLASRLEKVIEELEAILS